MDYRRFYDDKEMLYAYDLEEFAGRDAVFQIAKVRGGELTGEKGRKSKKPFVAFNDPDNKLRGKELALNKTNGKAIAKMYGKDASKWVGQWIAMYTTTVDYDGETRDCIRIRPQRPEMQQPARQPNGQRKAGPQKPPDVAAFIARLDACPDADTLVALETERAAMWPVLSKDDKLRIKAAVDAAGSRLPVSDGSELSAAEEAEIARAEAQAEIARAEAEAAQ